MNTTYISQPHISIDMYGTESIKKNPIKHPYWVGASMVVTIDPRHIERLEIDADTFFEEKPVENGILLERRTLSKEQNKHHTNDTSIRKSTDSLGHRLANLKPSEPRNP